METQLIKEAINKSKSKRDVLKLLGWNGGSGYTKLNQIIEKNNIDISHFDSGRSERIKYELIEKECPVCGVIFNTKKNHPREKTTCSHSCSNTYFRSGYDNPNWSDNRYRTTCFEHHTKECIICGEKKIVAVHHFDENKNNNNPENLIPLCPTHHQYVHSRYKDDVMDKIIEYRNNFIS